MFKFSLLLFLTLLYGGRAPAQDSTADTLLILINQARINSGLAPLAVNAQLAVAAQSHADDMARNGVGIGHSGTDGSTPTIRILRAGYGAYSWGPLVGENWAAFRTIEESMKMWMSDAPHRGNILRQAYREIGIGTGQSPLGAPILVTDFGAQPNKLPVFISGTGSNVTLTLTNEDAAPEGDGQNVMGLAVSVNLSNDPGFPNAQSLPYAKTLKYSTPDGQPITSVYVRFHDKAGRSTISTAGALTAVVVPAAAAAVSPTSTATRKPSSTRRPNTPTTLANRSPTETITRAPSIAPSSVPTQTRTPTDTPSPVRKETKLAYTPTSTPFSVTSVSAETEQNQIVTTAAMLIFGVGVLLLILAGAIAWRSHPR